MQAFLFQNSVELKVQLKHQAMWASTQKALRPDNVSELVHDVTAEYIFEAKNPVRYCARYCKYL